ncbi:rhomboid family intramembrane serine protease [Teredinibacter haidensis]|uniref:rhomboid family intramembrane serine protease n=1 Tax=Teredinibacter haidensis TaxID=2731755 RepID=UPI00094910A7|nr:rhomboid family intramembrane serine protease [Teredinibacter haidensis]
MIKRLLPTEALIFVALMWVIYLVDLLLPGFSFNGLGIQPRTFAGLSGIFFAPFLHGGLFHLVSNTLPLLVLAAILRLSIGAGLMVGVMFWSAMGSGIGVWLFGFGGIVVGASGMVFGLIGFLFANAYFNPSLRSWLCAGISFVLYSGTLLSLLRLLPHISWAAHFWGFVAGMMLAALFRKQEKQSAST